MIRLLEDAIQNNKLSLLLWDSHMFSGPVNAPGLSQRPHRLTTSLEVWKTGVDCLPHRVNQFGPSFPPLSLLATCSTDSHPHLMPKQSQTTGVERKLLPSPLHKAYFHFNHQVCHRMGETHPFKYSKVSCYQWHPRPFLTPTSAKISPRAAEEGRAQSQ